MSFRLYNKHFKIGVAFNILIFACLNIWSFTSAKRVHDASVIKFGPDFLWGLPFAWNWDTSIGLGFTLNVAVIALFSFVFGFVFRSVGSVAK